MKLKQVCNHPAQFVKDGSILSGRSGKLNRLIEEAFSRTKLSLFPVSGKDLKTDCSCPDWANLCKHIAAVYYLLAEQFDEDPFLIFKLRGRTKEEIMEVLRQKRVVTSLKESRAYTAAGTAALKKASSGR